MTFDYASYLNGMPLTRVGERTEAGIHLTSLPLPRSAPRTLGLDAGGGVRPVFQKAVGRWPDQENAPRRMLLAADGENTAPDSIRVTAGTQQASAKGAAAPPMDASLLCFASCDDPFFAWERHMAVLSWGDRKLGLLLGMRTDEGVHWWEACRLVTISRTDFCLEVEIGGAIPRVIYDSRDYADSTGYRHPFLHKHNWLNGHIYLRLYANGVCEVYAHHINSKFFDDGLDIHGAVPVIGIKRFSKTEKRDAWPALWTGEETGICIGGASFDLSDARHLVGADAPGSFAKEGGFTVWQPYEACSLYGGAAPASISGDPYIFRAEARVIPRGMARTVRFSFSLSQRSPVVARYLAPAWWYGVCEEFSPAPLLPVSGLFDDVIDSACRYTADYACRGGFEDGSIPRNLSQQEGQSRYEPGWEGEMPGAQLMAAWRSGDAETYTLALRSAYAFTDLNIDHAVKLVRMHGFPPPGVSVPMNRVHGPVLAYLETGDPYLIHAACAVVDTAYHTHKNTWPRMCIGRDACFIRGAVLLYRYLGDVHYLELARDAISDVLASQRPDGSFGDQGGGTGIHQWAAYITKPWMAMMAIGGVVDYLEVCPGDADMLAGVKRLGDWLLRERHEHVLKSGERVTGWSYQHYFKDDTLFRIGSDRVVTLKDPMEPLWHVEYLARFMGFCTLTFGDPAYLDAWAASAGPYYAHHPDVMSDHAAAQVLQFLPWLADHLAGARLSQEGVVLDSASFAQAVLTSYKVAAPAGTLHLPGGTAREHA